MSRPGWQSRPAILFLVASVCSLLFCVPALRAESPVASYVFPAGGQRGTTVHVRVGGLFLHDHCGFEMLGPRVEASSQLQRMRTLWFEGPLLPLPDSQQAEDYPKDMKGEVRLAADAPLGERSWRVWTAQGATSALPFVVGDLPEIVEEEIDGAPVPMRVQLPVTINGRIFPRENVDLWAFEAHKGQTITAEVNAARLGSPLDSRLEVLDSHGRAIAENDDTFGADSFLRFTAPEDGRYQVKIHDVGFRGGQAYVYRLTLTADPHVDRVFPLGGRRGEKVRFALTGQGLPHDPVEIALPTHAPGDYLHRLVAGGKNTNPFHLDVDDLPEHVAQDIKETTKPLSLPAMGNGRIERSGMVDSWPIQLRKGEVCDLELRALRLGSPLTGVLALQDTAGKELARNESDGAADPRLHFTAPAAGTYLVRVSDRFHSRGGPEYAYRLRLDHPSPPDFHLQLAADVLTIQRNGQAKLKVQAERLGGHAEPIALTVEGLSPEITAGAVTIAAGQNSAEIPLKAAANAPIRAQRLVVRGTTKSGSHVATFRPAKGQSEVDSLLLAVVLPTPFKIVGEYDMRWVARGSVHRRHYRLERNGYDGPLEISLADRQARHVQGVTGPTITVPPGATEFDYAVQLPPWMETGRTCRICVMATGAIPDADGSKHTVCFSSVQQNEQIVAVIEPGRLGIESDRGSLRVEPGKEVAVAVRVNRGKGLTGPVKVLLAVPDHLHGIHADPIEVPADRSSGCLVLRFSKEARGPFNMPVVIRATLLDRGGSTIAETPIDLLAGQ